MFFICSSVHEISGCRCVLLRCSLLRDVHGAVRACWTHSSPHHLHDHRSQSRARAAWWGSPSLQGRQTKTTRLTVSHSTVVKPLAWWCRGYWEVTGLILKQYKLVKCFFWALGTVYGCWIEYCADRNALIVEDLFHGDLFDAELIFHLWFYQALVERCLAYDSGARPAFKTIYEQLVAWIQGGLSEAFGVADLLPPTFLYPPQHYQEALDERIPLTEWAVQAGLWCVRCVFFVKGQIAFLNCSHLRGCFSQTESTLCRI